MEWPNNILKLSEKEQLEYFYQEDAVIILIYNRLCGGLSRLFDIITYCGYDIERYIKNYYEWTIPNNYWLSSTLFFKMIDDNLKEIGDEKLLSMKENNKKRYDDFLKFIEKHGYADGAFDYEKVIQNGSVKRLLISAERLFLLDNSLINPNNYKNNDYSYLILNFVKSLERYLFYKLNILGLIGENEKSKLTFKDLSDRIVKYAKENTNDAPKELLDCYERLLNSFRQYYRNGYFHRDILSRKNASITIELSTILMVLTHFIIDC